MTPFIAPPSSPARAAAAPARAARVVAPLLLGAWLALHAAPGSAATAAAPAAATARASAAASTAARAAPSTADDSAEPSTEQALAQARVQLDGVQKELRAESTSDARLAELRAAALKVQAAGDRAAADLEPTLARVQARLDELGPVPDGAGEAADVATQRAALERQRKQVDAQVKLARLLSVEGAQAAGDVAGRRRAQFTARIGERTASILSPTFWNELRANGPADAAALRSRLGAVLAAARQTPPLVWAALALAIAAVLVGARLLLQRLLDVASRRVPAGRLRRSLLALAVTVLGAAGPGIAAELLVVGLDWRGTLPADLRAFLSTLATMVWLGAYMAALASALLSRRRPSWRLPPLPDSVVNTVAPYPPWVAAAIVLSWSGERLAALLNASLATAVALECISALVVGGLVARALHRLARSERRGAAGAQTDGVPQGEAKAAGSPAVAPSAGAARHAAAVRQAAAGVTAAAMLGWLIFLLALACLLLGYVAVGSFIVRQAVWIATVVGTVYLLMVLIDDAVTAWLAPPRPGDKTASAGVPGAAAPAPDTPARLRAQAGVVFSAVLRLAVLLSGLVLVAAPFGQQPTDLLQRTAQLRAGLAIGEIRLQPGAVLQAVAVLVAGLAAVRLAQRWLRQRLLPTTGLDAAMRDSVSTLLGFIGSIGAVALALSAIGLGLERIAWVASALSVGIGFGLQAVVSNFVSGLILLAERPVKVGDWVSLGSGVEGDIRRINVRATEIQMADRSTVIVPNSEFITKTVRNVTMANPMGVVTVKFAMPLATDVERVREIVLQILCDNPDVRDDPPPNVFLDGIEGGALVINANGTVASPRQAYSVKSALLFEILKRLRAADIALSSGPTMVLRDAAPPPPERIAAGPPAQ